MRDFSPVSLEHRRHGGVIHFLKTREHDALDALKSAQVFVVNSEIEEAAAKIRAEEISHFFQRLDAKVSDRHPTFPVGAVLPSASVMLDFGGGDQKRWSAFCMSDSDGWIWVWFLADVAVFFVGRYLPGSVESFISSVNNQQSISSDQRVGLLYDLAFTLAMISQPRVVLRRPALSRQVRREMQRGMGATPIGCYTRVSWNLDSAVVAKLSRDPSFHKMPYHFRRGHNRRAEPHYAGARYLSGVSAPRAAGWYQWIDEKWVGHPAFGIKKSYHAPKLGGAIS